MAKHSDIFEAFKQMMPNVDIEDYWACGYNTIRIRFVDQSEYVFMFTSAKNWRLETVDSFLQRLEIKNKVLH